MLSPQVKTKIQVLGKPIEGTDIKDYGLQLRQFAALLKVHCAKVDVHELKAFRDIDTEKKTMIENNFIMY